MLFCGVIKSRNLLIYRNVDNQILVNPLQQLKECNEFTLSDGLCISILFHYILDFAVLSDFKMWNVIILH